MARPRTFAPKSLLVGSGAAALVLAGSLVAWACTNLATLESDPATGQSGDEITLTGQNFASDGSEIAIRFNSLQGPVLATAKADETGEFTTRMTVPNVPSGQYVLIATQFAEAGGGHGTQSGEPAFGTPARVAFIVPGPSGETAPAPASQVQPQPVASIAPSSQGSTLGWIVLGVVGLFALTLFGAGLVSFLGEVRRREVPASVPVER